MTVEIVEQINGRATEDLRKVISEDDGILASARDQNFGVPFGRDAAIASEFLLDIYEKHPKKKEFLPLVKNSLITMAVNQGQVVDPRRDEEPGKTHHEKRREEAFIELGEVYNKNLEIMDGLAANHWPVDGERGHRSMLYFGSVDATPLFVSAACRYLLITNDREFFEFLNPHIKRAIEWMQNYGDILGDGYIRFSAKNRNALINQGWKDSFDSIEIVPSRRPKEPIALVEVQGYAYEAYLRAAELYRRIGDIEYANNLYQKAGILKVRFNQDFWMDDEKFFAYALGGDDKQVREIVSNVGHLLVTGIIDDEKVPFVVNRLMQPDMLTDWGIRTLSANSPNFSDEEPSAYHNGSIWPHDNEMIARGLRRLDYVKEANEVESRLLLVEKTLNDEFGERSEENFIVDKSNRLRPYNGSQKPQAWAAAAYHSITTV